MGRAARNLSNEGAIDLGECATNHAQQLARHRIAAPKSATDGGQVDK